MSQDVKRFQYRRPDVRRFEVEVESGGTDTTYVFSAYGDIPGESLLAVQELGAKLEAEAELRSKLQLQEQMLTEFFGYVLPPAELTRFRDLVNGDGVIAAQLLADIMMWLIEEYTGRPIGQQPSS